MCLCIVCINDYLKICNTKSAESFVVELCKNIKSPIVTRPEDPTREGYSLEGWYADIDKTIPWNFDTDTVLGNMSLYAKWEEYSGSPIIEEPMKEDHCNWWWLILLGTLLLIIIIIIPILLPRKKVTFNSMGGSKVKAKHVLKNGKIKAPRTPGFHGKLFGGWYKDLACTIPWNFETDKVKENITLYAKWV